MKNVFATLALSLTTTSAFATPIPEAQLPAYKKAIELALSQTHLQCLLTSGVSTFDFYRVVVNATSAEINIGTQPALIFTFLSADRKRKTEVKVITSADKKYIVSMSGDASYLVQGVQNDGTLENPVIVPKWKSYTTAVCK